MLSQLKPAKNRIDAENNRHYSERPRTGEANRGT